MKNLLFTILLLFSLQAFAQQNKAAEAIRLVLETQRIAWNNGDIEKFMDAYWHSDSLMFIGKSGITYGWQNTLNNYKKGYPDTASMGKLQYDIIQVKPLSAIYCSVFGKWHLSRSIGDIGGHFTLLLRKIKNKWVIVSDHSSS